jgi:monofunctional glycosyltransferase
LLVIVALLFILDTARYFVYPDISKLKAENPTKTSYMRYREKQWKIKGLKDKKIKQTWKSFYSISRNLRVAVEITEDAYFWGHHGFEWDAITRAFETNWKEGFFKFGASTITQQLARNLYLTPSKNPIRKIKEAIITWRLEKTLEKQRIMEIYLNVIEWGDGIYGAEAAARYHFHKSAISLLPQEAARLAMILPNPRKLNPHSQSKYSVNRVNVIVDALRKRGVIKDDSE